MKINTILFDLDGTLVPIDGDDFVKAYFKELVTKFAPLGYDPEKLVRWIWAGTEKMILNDGTKSNFDAFWDEMERLSQKNVRKDIPLFDSFYLNEFDNVKKLIPQNYNLRPLFNRLHDKGYKLILATNPFFPHNASITRLSWIGLNINDFEYISTMENSYYTKPNLNYYQDIFKKLDLNPENCLMVGNNPIEDMCIEKLGCKVFLIPEFLENKKSIDCANFPQGTFSDLESFLNQN